MENYTPTLACYGLPMAAPHIAEMPTLPLTEPAPFTLPEPFQSSAKFRKHLDDLGLPYE